LTLSRFSAWECAVRVGFSRGLLNVPRTQT
jgi:hypothetical protein